MGHRVFVALLVIGCEATGDPAVSTDTAVEDAITIDTSVPETPALLDTAVVFDTTTEEASVPSATRKIRDLTGPGTSSKKFGVGGTDLGIPVRQPNGQIAYIFGDTFEKDGVGGAGWRSPVLLRSAPGGLAAGIDFTSAAGGTYGKQLLDYRHDTTAYTTWLPTDAITVGSRMYLHYMVNKGLGNVLWTKIAYSDDNGENWIDSAARWEGSESGGLRQVWTWERGDDGYVYVMSTSFRGPPPSRSIRSKLSEPGALSR